MTKAEQKKLDMETLHELVTLEATKLRKKANEDERKSLDFSILSTKSTTQCIYGQMTGDCFSDRATELIKTCAKRVYICGYKENSIHGELNGSPKNEYRSNFWSPIEIFIDKPRNKKNGNNKRLIAYIKGESDKLVLK